LPALFSLLIAVAYAAGHGQSTLMSGLKVLKLASSQALFSAKFFQENTGRFSIGWHGLFYQIGKTNNRSGLIASVEKRCLGMNICFMAGNSYTQLDSYYRQ